MDPGSGVGGSGVGLGALQADVPGDSAAARRWTFTGDVGAGGGGGGGGRQDSVKIDWGVECEDTAPQVEVTMSQERPRTAPESTCSEADTDTTTSTAAALRLCVSESDACLMRTPSIEEAMGRVVIPRQADPARPVTPKRSRSWRALFSLKKGAAADNEESSGSEAGNARDGGGSTGRPDALGSCDGEMTPKRANAGGGRLALLFKKAAEGGVDDGAGEEGAGGGAGGGDEDTDSDGSPTKLTLKQRILGMTKKIKQEREQREKEEQKLQKPPPEPEDEDVMNLSQETLDHIENAKRTTGILADDWWVPHWEIGLLVATCYFVISVTLNDVYQNYWSTSLHLPLDCIFSVAFCIDVFIRCCMKHQNVCIFLTDFVVLCPASSSHPAHTNHHHDTHTAKSNV